jgi:hypothetical protein
MNIIKFVRNRGNSSNPYQDLDNSRISGLDASIKRDCDDAFGDFTDANTATSHNRANTETENQSLFVFLYFIRQTT